MAGDCSVFLIGSLLTMPDGGKAETIQETMRDAVLHESNQISFFGLRTVNPALISGMVVTAVLLIAATCIRIFVIPKFRYVPGRFQMLLEQAVGMFDGMAKSNSPWRNSFLGAYIFAAAAYIFFGTLFELFGFQVITTEGLSIALPAPLSDVNAAIMLGVLSYCVIFSGAIAGNGIRGIGSALKEVSLLISMSFRLFGALLSGLLVTETGLLLHQSQLCPAGCGRRAVHIAARADSELRFDHADGAVLRRDVRAQGPKQKHGKKAALQKPEAPDLV